MHRVLTESHRQESALPGLAVTPNTLADLIRHLTAEFDCVTVTEGLKRLHAHSAPARPLLALTFDDGRRDNFLYARPILNAYNVPATFYIPAGFVGSSELLWHDAVGYAAAAFITSGRTRELNKLLRTNMKYRDAQHASHWTANHLKSFHENDRRQIELLLQREAGEFELPVFERSMDWNDLRQLVREGHEIGSHTMTHAVLGENQTHRLEAEIVTSKSVLEENLSVEIRSFSYPTGATSESAVEWVSRAGYESAVTTQAGVNCSQTPTLHLRRINIQEDQNHSADGRLNEAVLSWRMARAAGAV